MTTRESADRRPCLEASDLTLTIGGHALLQNAGFRIEPGQLVVLVGASGTGKTVLLRLLAGVLRPSSRGLQASGDLHFDGVHLLRQRPPAGRIGILFQHHALFDGMTARENIRFAERHRRRRGDPRRGDELLEHLGIQPRALPRTMSGGQQQRLALARTLALDPELVLYDEPTTGLDPANARKVAELIAETHRARQSTSLVVTHDIATLVPIADRVLLLDARQGTIVEQPTDAAAVDEALFALERDRTPVPPTPPTVPGLAPRLLEGTADIVGTLANTLLHLIPTGPRLRDGWRFFVRALSLTASWSSFAYFAAAGIILGFVATYFTFEYMPKRGFTEPLFIDYVLRALGFLLYRVLCPVILTILVAARMGAAFASDIGNQVYSRQFDAMQSFGVRPSRYVLTASLWAMLLGVPALYAVHFLVARTVSELVFLHGHPDATSFFWDRNFHRALRLDDATWWSGTAWLLLKLELCAFGTTAVAWFYGTREKEAAEDVSSAVTRTIIVASLWTLLVHFALAFIEF